MTLNDSELPDWKSKMLKSLHEHGFPTVTDFLRNRQNSTFDDLSNELGGAFTPIQFEKMILTEVMTPNDLRYCARDLLVRQLRRKCPKGWRQCKEFDQILAISSWGAAFGDRNLASVNKVGNRLRALEHLPSSWLPTGADDPIIVELFLDVELSM